MGSVLARLVLLTLGIGLGQLGLDSFAHGAVVTVVQLALALVLLVAGSAGFIGPLLGRVRREEGRSA